MLHICNISVVRKHSIYDSFLLGNGLQQNGLKSCTLYSLLYASVLTGRSAYEFLCVIPPELCIFSLFLRFRRRCCNCTLLILISSGHSICYETWYTLCQQLAQCHDNTRPSAKALPKVRHVILNAFADQASYFYMAHEILRNTTGINKQYTIQPQRSGLLVLWEGNP